MAKWERTNGEAVTVESRVSVTDGERTGWVGIAWECGGPQFRGPVYADGKGEVEILDEEPVF